jgi:hypothetical protein
MCSRGLIALRWSASPSTSRDRLGLSVQATRLRLSKCQTLGYLSRQQFAEAGSISRTTGPDCGRAKHLRVFRYPRSSGNPEVCSSPFDTIMLTAIAGTAAPLPSITMQKKTELRFVFRTAFAALGEGLGPCRAPFSPSRPVRSGHSSTWEKAESGNEVLLARACSRRPGRPFPTRNSDTHQEVAIPPTPL